MTLTQKQFDLDPSLTTKALSLLTPAANDDAWQTELDNDPDYLVWLEQQAEMHAFATGADYA